MAFLFSLVVCLRNNEIRKSPLLKKVVYSIFQAYAFLKEYRKRSGRFDIRVIETGWPNSKWQNKFLIVGHLSLKESDICIKVQGKLYSLDNCPQRDFFEKLDCSRSLENDSYYLLAKSSLEASDFEFWLDTRRILWLNFLADEHDFTPIATMNASGKFVVEDGAHRLALRNLRGHLSHQVALSLWSFGALKLNRNRS